MPLPPPDPFSEIAGSRCQIGKLGYRKIAVEEPEAAIWCGDDPFRGQDIKNCLQP